MPCKKCEWYRRRMSPREDKFFTTKYKAVEPVEWLSKQVVTSRGTASITVDLRSLFREAFKRPHTDTHELTLLGRTLDALGWRRIKKDGYLYFVMPLDEFRRDLQ